MLFQRSQCWKKYKWWQGVGCIDNFWKLTRIPFLFRYSKAVSHNRIYKAILTDIIVGLCNIAASLISTNNCKYILSLVHFEQLPAVTFVPQNRITISPRIVSSKNSSNPRIACNLVCCAMAAKLQSLWRNMAIFSAEIPRYKLDR